MKRNSIVLVLSLFSNVIVAQSDNTIQLVNNVDPATLTQNGKQLIQASKYQLVKIDIDKLTNKLQSASHLDAIKSGKAVYIELPLADGSFHKYRILKNNTMDPDLAKQFPEISTYNGYGAEGFDNEFVKLDITPKGFHAMIMIPGKRSIFIDPFVTGNNEYYMVYSTKNFITNKKMNCGVTNFATPSFSFPRKSSSLVDFTTCELRTHRLALAATFEYTQFSGGTKAAALANEVTTMNRVNGIYEVDAGITMKIIPNNTSIIYDTTPDPYTSGNAGLMITENQANIDLVIGTANYDIGHVFDANTTTAGLAQIASVCNPALKAEGVTGQDTPVGDAFDVDYVAHEIGHQFGANHTFNNSCNGNRFDPTAVEPGSGSTIMGYAGICPPNVQNNSGAYFHGVSLQEIGDFTSSANDNCAVRTPITGAPIINTSNGNSFVPQGTPFALSAQATSVNPTNVLTYDWEQMDPQITPQPPQSTAVDGPNFRSFFPSKASARYFPNLIALANNGPFTWEVVPTVGRIMNYRVSVRNNTPGGSCNSYMDYTVTTDEFSGPFEVTYPSAVGVNWLGGSPQIVSWNVANSNNSPVNALYVNILLSTDGGATYPIVIATNLPNVGTASIIAPNVNTQNARIMVTSSTGTFFNISANSFVINPLPILRTAIRNPLSNRTEAFIYYDNYPTPTGTESYVVNGLPGAQARLDLAKGRFVITGVNTPRKVDISLTVTRNGVSATTNLITIPAVL